MLSPHGWRHCIELLPPCSLVDRQHVVLNDFYVSLTPHLYAQVTAVQTLAPPVQDNNAHFHDIQASVDGNTLSVVSVHAGKDAQ